MAVDVEGIGIGVGRRRLIGVKPEYKVGAAVDFELLARCFVPVDFAFTTFVVLIVLSLGMFVNILLKQTMKLSS